MTDLYGNYRSQTTRALQSIDSTKYADTNKDFEKNIQRLNNFVDYIAEYLQVMQKGVDKANQDPITNLRNTITDLGILLAGGELLYGIDLGDLQYFLPAIAAMFGFDSDKPFPINLLYAAEHFLLGYIIPLDSWAYAIMDIIDTWAIAFGLPPDFVEALHNLLLALQAVTTDYIDYFNGLANLITIFDVSSALGDVSGPLGQLWAVLRTLFGEGNDLPTAIDLLGPAGNALAPWVQLLADLVTNFDLIVKAFAAGAYDIAGLLNLGNMITNVVSLIPLIGTFDPVVAWAELFTNALTAAVIPNLDASKIVSGIISASRLQGLIDAVSVGFGGSTGLGYSGLQSWLAGLPTPQAVIDYLYNTLTGDSGSGHSLTDLGVALVAFPANFISGILDAAVVPGLDASKIITGILPAPRLQGLVDAVSQAYSGSPGLGYAALQSYLAGLPTAQQVIDYIYNTLTGGSGTGHTLANLVSALSAYPASLINGVLASINIPSLDASKIVTGIINIARAPWAAPIDTLVNAWGLSGANFTAIDLANIAALIPPANMVGVLGGTNIGNTIQKVLDAGIQAINNIPSSVNNTVAQFMGALNSMANFLGYVTTGSAPTNSVAQISSATQDLVKQRAIQNAVSANIDPTASASFDLSEITNGGTTLPTIPITQTKSVIAYITARDGGIKQAISWLGYGVTNVTDFYVNVGTVNKTTGVFTKIYSTANIIGGVGTGSTPVWNSVNLPALNYINTTSGDRLAVEFVIRGTGNYNIVGKTWNTQLPTHPTLTTAFPAANRFVDVAPSVTNVASARTTAINSPNPVTLSITVGANDNAVVVGVNAYQASTISATITIGGNAMTPIGSSYNYTSDSYIHWYGYQFTAGSFTGSKTVSFSYSGGSWLLELQAWSMKDVSTFGTPVGTAANSSAISHTISSNSTQHLLNIMAQNSTGNNITAYNKTARTNYAWSSGAVVPFQSGDSIGSSSVTFTASVTGGGAWGSSILPVNGSVGQPPTTIANPTVSGGNVNWANTVPWCALSGVAGQTQFSPVITPMMDGAPMSYTPPSWANYFDVVIWPGGASGTSGAGLVGGFGGNGSTPTVVTLTKAQISGANWTWTNGAGGAATSPYGVPGNNGAASNVVVPGYGTINANAVGTGNGSTSGASGLPGGTAGSATVGGNYYPGGAGGGSPQAAGAQPGGGGAGGNATYLNYVGGGQGGYGGGYICARQ